MSCPSMCGVRLGCSLVILALVASCGWPWDLSRDAAVRKLLHFDASVLYDRVFGGESLDGDFLLFFKRDADDVEV
jgi:hypothetical protein